MTFTPNLRAAARRHLEAGNKLNGAERRDVAGYLFGIAAECAVKAMLIDAGFRPAAQPRATNDPFYMHFPELKTWMTDNISSRIGSPMKTFVQASFMNNWSTRMRYTDGKDIDHRWIDSWADQAKQAVASIGT